MGGFLIFVGLIGLFIGVIGSIGNGARQLGIGSRRAGGVVVSATLLLVAVGVLLGQPSDETRLASSLSTEDNSPSPAPTSLTSPTASHSPSPSPAPSPTSAVPVIAAAVIRVIDGDTAEMSLQGRSERVRFIGMDAPERGRPYFNEATAYTTQLIGGKTLFLESDIGQRDRYGRLLAYLWLSEPFTIDEASIRASMVNARLLLEGYASVMTIPPNIRYVDWFTSFQTESRNQGRGLWAQPVPSAPPPAPKPKPTAPPSSDPPSSNCHSSYEGECIPKDVSDADCAGGSGNGPYYVQTTVKVVGPDVFGLDADNDGWGCDHLSGG